MTLTRWQRPDGLGLAAVCPSCTPQEGLSQLLQSFGTIFDSPLDASPETQFPGDWLPAVDVHDGKEAVMVKAELPGLKKEDISISLQEGVLTLSGERKGSRETDGGGMTHCERWFGRFERSIRLPCEVDAKTVKAAYTDGVLTIELAKAEKAKPKQVKIQFS